MTPSQLHHVSRFRAKLLCAAAGVGIALIALSAETAHAEDTTPTFQHVPATVQRFQAATGDVVNIDGHHVPAGGYLMRVNDQASVLALSLDPRIPSASAIYNLAAATPPALGRLPQPCGYTRMPNT